MRLATLLMYDGNPRSAADLGRMEGDAFVMGWEYVVLTARRAAGSAVT